MTTLPRHALYNVFAVLTDPRIDRTTQHRLLDIDEQRGTIIASPCCKRSGASN